MVGCARQEVRLDDLVVPSGHKLDDGELQKEELFASSSISPNSSLDQEKILPALEQFIGWGILPQCISSVNGAGGDMMECSRYSFLSTET